MIASDIAGILLAAGFSERFGAEDKLLAPFRGAPLVRHAARTMIDAGFGKTFAVVAANNAHCIAELESQGLAVIENPEPSGGQGLSLSLGVKAASAFGAKGAMVTLGDMPFVRAATLNKVCAAIGDADAAVSLATRNSTTVRMPPVLFSARVFSSLQYLRGDTGAREILAGLDRVVPVPLDEHCALDIDTLEDLNQATSERSAVL